MNSIYKLVAAGAALIAISQPVLAIKLLNAPVPTQAPAATPKIIERGGTITEVDFAKKTLTVDGITYNLPASQAVIHPPRGSKTNATSNELKAGMMIRFTTSKENFSAQTQIVEIWVTRLTSATPKNLK